MVRAQPLPEPAPGYFDVFDREGAPLGPLPLRYIQGLILTGVLGSEDRVRAGHEGREYGLGGWGPAKEAFERRGVLRSLVGPDSGYLGGDLDDLAAWLEAPDEATVIEDGDDAEGLSIDLMSGLEGAEPAFDPAALPPIAMGQKIPAPPPPPDFSTPLIVSPGPSARAPAPIAAPEPRRPPAPELPAFPFTPQDVDWANIDDVAETRSLPKVGPGAPMIAPLGEPGGIPDQRLAELDRPAVEADIDAPAESTSGDFVPETSDPSLDPRGPAGLGTVLFTSVALMVVMGILLPAALPIDAATNSWALLTRVAVMVVGAGLLMSRHGRVYEGVQRAPTFGTLLGAVVFGLLLGLAVPIPTFGHGLAANIILQLVFVAGFELFFRTGARPILHAHLQWPWSPLLSGLLFGAVYLACANPWLTAAPSSVLGLSVVAGAIYAGQACYDETGASSVLTHAIAGVTAMIIAA